jgi:hypothetical protein
MNADESSVFSRLRFSLPALITNPFFLPLSAAIGGASAFIGVPAVVI